MIGPALSVAAVTLACGLAVAVVASRLPTLRAQLVALIIGVIALPLAGVLIGGPLMLSPSTELAALGALLAASSASLVGAWMVARRLIRPLHALRAATTRVADGDLHAVVDDPTATRELRQLGMSFNAMTARLRQLQDTRSQLTAWVSHDLRTPIASLRAMVEAVQDGVVPADHYVDAMHDQLRTLGAMVDDLFELAQLQTRTDCMPTAPAAIDAIVARCCAAAGAEAAQRGVMIEQIVPTHVAPVVCSAPWIERVVQNLLRNAVTFSPLDGRVVVEIQRTSHELVVAVNDAGPGLTPETRERMFDNFWRGDLARSRDGSGAGLGLAIARGLVEAHGGRIWAESRIHGGARVAFALPTGG